MTKAKLRESYLAWNKSITELDKEESFIWECMKDLSQKMGDGNRWCSELALMESVKGTNAFPSMVTYIKRLSYIEGQRAAMLKLAELTNNFDIGGTIK